MGAHDLSGAALSWPRALVTILKAMIGAGCLALPFMFAQVGLALALPLMVVVAYLNALGTWRLVEAKIILSEEGKEENIREDWGLGPVAAVAHAMFGFPGILVAAFVVLSAQVGIGIVLVDLTVHTLEERWSGVVSVLAIRLGLCGLLCVLCLVRELRDIAWLAGAALAVYCYVVFTLLKWGADTLNDTSTTRGTFLPVRWEGVSMLLGPSIFAFEGVTVAQYVYDAMRIADPRPFISALTVSYVIACILYTFIGGFGYYCYGSLTAEVIYDNFPAGSVDVLCVEYVLCAVLILSFVLQMYPVFCFMESVGFGVHLEQGPSEDEPAACSESDCEKSKEDDSATEEEKEEHGSVSGTVCDVLLRCAIVMATCILAAVMPDPATAMDYVGSFSFSMIGFILPAVFHIKACGLELSACAWASDVLLLVTGVVAMALGLQSAFGG